MTNPYGHEGRPDFIDSTPSESNNGPGAPSYDSSEALHRGQQSWPVQQEQPSGLTPQQPQQNSPEPAQAEEHPKSMTVLVLGILGFLLWIPGVIGWVIGGSAKKNIKQGNAPYPWDGALRAGYTLSVLSTVLGLVYLFAIFAFGAMIAALMQ